MNAKRGFVDKIHSERTKQFIPTDDIIPPHIALSRLSFAKFFLEKGKDFIDQMVYGDNILNKQKGIRAKIQLEAAISTVTGDRNTDFAKLSLSKKDQSRLNEMMQEVIIGNAPFLLIQRTPGGSSLIESYSHTVFELEDEKEKSTGSK